MRLLIGLFAVLSAFAQVKYEVCVRKTVGAKSTEACVTLPTDIKQAIAQDMSADPHAYYQGPSDYFFKQVFRLVFAPLLDKYPSSAVQAAKAALDAAQAQLQAAKDAALPPVPTGEP